MNALRETPSVIVLLTIAAVVAGIFALWPPGRSLVDVAVYGSAFSAFLYMVFYSFVRGIGPPFVIGLGAVSFLYLPLSFVTALASRLLLRRKLRIFRGTQEYE